MPDQPHCRWCGVAANRVDVVVDGWYCTACHRWQNVMGCPCCGGTVSVERVEAYLGRPVGGSREAAGGE